MGRTSDNGFKKARKRAGLTQEEFCNKFNEFEEHAIKDGSQRSVTLDTCRNWEQGRKLPRAGTLIELSKFYGVSTDFLLGLSECVFVDNEYIREKTGLNDNSISMLETVRKESEIERQIYDLRNNNSSLTVTDTLNIMCKYDTLAHIAKGFRNYLLTEYAVPVQYEPEQGKFTYSDSDYSKQNHKEINAMCEAFGVASFPDHYIMHLARTPEHPEDNIAFTLSKEFLEAAAIQQIESSLQTLKKLYKKETEKKEGA